MPSVKVQGKTVKFPYTSTGIKKAKSMAKEEKGEIKIKKPKKGLLSSGGMYMGK